MLVVEDTVSPTERPYGLLNANLHCVPRHTDKVRQIKPQQKSAS